MVVELNKTVTLTEEEKELLRGVILIIENLNDELNDDFYDYSHICGHLEEIIYHGPWEVNYESH